VRNQLQTKVYESILALDAQTFSSVAYIGKNIFKSKTIQVCRDNRAAKEVREGGAKSSHAPWLVPARRSSVGRLLPTANFAYMITFQV
jgi:hypothetical protein